MKLVISRSSYVERFQMKYLQSILRTSILHISRDYSPNRANLYSAGNSNKDKNANVLQFVSI